jgi:hypothetical protein
LTPWPMAMEGAVQEEDVPAKVKDKWRNNLKSVSI